MKNRRGFLAAISAVSAGTVASAMMAAKSKAETPPPAAQASTSEPSPTARASVAPKAPSAAALAFAATYRAFDPKLSDAELATIARGIDDNRTAAAALAKKRPLSNGDEPVARFAAAERLEV